MNQMANIIAARTAMPPTTPPTMAPMGVDFFFEFVFGLSFWLMPGAESPIDADATLEAEAKDTLTGLALVFVVTDPAPLKSFVSEAVLR